MNYWSNDPTQPSLTSSGSFPSYGSPPPSGATPPHGPPSGGFPPYGGPPPGGMPPYNMPPRPPATFYRYPLWLLLGLAVLYALGWIFAVAGTHQQPDGTSTTTALGDIGIGLFLSILTAVLILDWHGFRTLRGAVHWERHVGGARALLVGVFILFSFLLVAPYLVRVFVDQRRALAAPGVAVPAAAPSASRGWKLPVALMSGGVVMLLVVCSSLGATANGVSGATATPTPRQITQHPTATPTSTHAPTADSPTPTPSPTATPQPSPTPTPTPTPSPSPTPTPKPKPPTPTPKPKPSCAYSAVNGNPWCYNFSCCKNIYSPPSNFCGYFNCIASFWSGSGFVEECQDGTYSKSGGRSGSCSHHGGNWRALLQP